MRTEWVKPGQGSTFIALFLEVMEHGTREQALEVSRLVNENREWFLAHRYCKTGLLVDGHPDQPLQAYDLERAVEAMRRWKQDNR